MGAAPSPRPTSMRVAGPLPQPSARHRGEDACRQDFDSQLEPSPDGNPVVSAELVDRLARRHRTAGLRRVRRTKSPPNFERVYRDDPDPWRFATSAYEQRRYDITIACLPEARYRRAFEPACAIGELTRRLAVRDVTRWSLGTARPPSSPKPGDGWSTSTTWRWRRRRSRSAGRLATSTSIDAQRDRLLLRTVRAPPRRRCRAGVARERRDVARRALARPLRPPRPAR